MNDPHVGCACSQWMSTALLELDKEVKRLREQNMGLATENAQLRSELALYDEQPVEADA